MNIAKDFGKVAAREAGLAYFASIFCAVIAGICCKTIEERPERYVVTGFLGIVALVLSCWTLVLACRAIHRGNRWVWPAVPLISVELSTFFLLAEAYAKNGNSSNSTINEFIDATGLPFFVPFFTAAWILASLYAVARMDRWSHLCHSVYWRKCKSHFLIVMAMLTSAFLPPSLFTYCACRQRYWRVPYKPDWRDYVAEHTPNLLRDSVVSILPRIHLRLGYTCVCSILENGHCSRETLLEHIKNPLWWGRHDDGDGDCALRAFQRLYPADVLGWALSNQEQRYDECTGQVIAKDGTSEQVRKCLRDHANRSRQFFWGLCIGLYLDRKKRPEFLPELIEIASDESAFKGDWRHSNGGDALRAIANLLPEEQVTDRMLEYLHDYSHPARQKCAEATLQVMATKSPAFVELSIHEFANGNTRFRREFLIPSALFGCRYNKDQESMSFPWVEQLQTVLDSSDVVLRRGAVHSLSDLFREPVPSTPLPKDFNANAWNDADRLPETNMELAELNYIRTKTESWLKPRRSQK